MPTKNEQLELCNGTIALKEAEEGLGLNSVVAKIAQKADEVIEIIQAVAETAYKCAMWARTNRPRLVHLSCCSKKARTRKKNTARLLREFYKEAKP